jgi:hypothetical protein
VVIGASSAALNGPYTNLNTTKSGVSPQIAAATMATLWLPSAIKIAFHPSLPCLLKAQTKSWWSERAHWFNSTS